MVPLAPEVFERSPVFLRVWFDGGRGFEQLSPDFELTSVRYAQMAARAGSVANGAVTADAFASGAIGSALTAEGIGVWTDSGAGLSSTRNIGIGTAAPAQALDVSGNIRLSGSIRAAGGQPFEVRLENEPVLRITPAGHSSDPRPNVILGAPSNTITGANTLSATISGGADNIASGSYSFAAGRRATAGHSGSFVWSDNSTSVFASTANNQFLIRAGGGVGIGTNNPAGALHVMGNTLVGSAAGDHRLGVGTDNPWTSLHVVSNADQDPMRVAVGDNNNTALRIYANRGTGIGNSWSDNAIPTRGLRVHGQTLLGDTVGINTSNPNSDAPLHVKGKGIHGLIIESAVNPGGWNLRVDDWGEWLIFSHGQNVAGGFNGRAYIRDDGSYNRFSDEALKRDIEPAEELLDKVLSLEPVSYSFISGGAEARRQYGFVAQQVREVFPEIVNEHEELEYLGLSYETFSVLAIQAIREQQAIIDHQAADIAELRAELAGLTAVAGQNEDLALRLARIEGWMESLGEEIP